MKFPCLLQVKGEYLAQFSNPMLVFFEAPGVGTIVHGNTEHMCDSPRADQYVGFRDYNWDMELFEPFDHKAFI